MLYQLRHIRHLRDVPHNSRLNTMKFQQNFNLVLPAWHVGVKPYAG
jgi:dTDP-4-dehydrorhamnose reductase (EC 1.1.1.133)